MVQCKDKGIDLMVIEEKDWIDNKNEKINKIRDFVEEKTVKHEYKEIRSN